MKTPPTIYDSQGSPLVLGRLLGRGGEGEVHELAADGKRVAKLYHKPLSKEHAEKLRAMTGLKTEALLRVAAWPVDSCHRRPGGEIVGLVMPKVSGYQEIHHLYSPKSRISAFPDATWRFLLHAAANLSRAFAVIHEHGHLVGDVNHGNALVSRQATVRLIDCDSFQIQAGGRRFLCGVGVSTHVPPELQAGSLHVVRTVDHDAFGLAVLIFQILFMGRHPYSGQYLGSGEMPIERAIRENRFAYGPAAGLRQMRQPPNTLDLAAASRPVADLFQRAFSPPGAARPRAHEWVAALDAVKTSTCARNPAHLYLEGLPSCPWCDLESRAGTIFFYLAAVHHVPGTGFDTFEVMAVWARISAVAGPGAPPAIPDPAAYDMPPSVTALAMSRKRVRQTAAAGVVVIGLISAVYDGSPVSSFLVAVVLALAILHATDPAREEAKQRLKDAQATFRKLQEVWPQQSDDAPFRLKRGELEGLKEEHRGLPAFRQKKLAALEAGRRATQLERFLDRHRLDKARIPSIGPGRRATLQSYGIETAEDIKEQDILKVPGFGHALADNLLSWRRSIESKFVFDPAKGVDPADVAALDRTIAARKAQIERMLQTGGAELEEDPPPAHAPPAVAPPAARSRGQGDRPGGGGSAGALVPRARRKPHPLARQRHRPARPGRTADGIDRPGGSAAAIEHLADLPQVAIDLGLGEEPCEAHLWLLRAEEVVVVGHQHVAWPQPVEDRLGLARSLVVGGDAEHRQIVGTAVEEGGLAGPPRIRGVLVIHPVAHGLQVARHQVDHQGERLARLQIVEMMSAPRLFPILLQLAALPEIVIHLRRVIGKDGAETERPPLAPFPSEPDPIVRMILERRAAAGGVGGESVDARAVDEHPRAAGHAEDDRQVPDMVVVRMAGEDRLHRGDVDAGEPVPDGRVIRPPAPQENPGQAGVGEEGSQEDRILTPVQVEAGRSQIPDLHLSWRRRLRGPGRRRAFGMAREVEGRSGMVRRAAHDVAVAPQGERGPETDRSPKHGSRFSHGISFDGCPPEFLNPALYSPSNSRLSQSGNSLQGKATLPPGNARRSLTLQTSTPGAALAPARSRNLRSTSAWFRVGVAVSLISTGTRPLGRRTTRSTSRRSCDLQK